MTTKDITCCNGEYHICVNGKFYCAAPPNIRCKQQVKDVGKFTRGEKKIVYCENHQTPCSECDPHANTAVNAVRG